MDGRREAQQRSGRIGATILFAFAVLYGVAASRIEYAFSSDPLGPRVIPLGLAMVLGGLTVLYAVRPRAAETWPRGTRLARIVSVPALVVAAALFLKPLGFPFAVFVMTTGVARVFDASWRFSVIGGLVQAAFWYALFSYVFEVYLPLGSLFAL